MTKTKRQYKAKEPKTEMTEKKPDFRHLRFKAAKTPQLFNKNELYTRQTSLERAVGFYWLENPDPVMQATGKDVETLRLIERDSHLTAVLQSRKAGTNGMLWEISKEKARARVVKFVEDNFNQLKIKNTITDMLNCLPVGYQPMEPVWGPDETKTKWMVKSFTAKPPEWFVYNENNELLFKSASNLNGEKIPPYKIIVARHNPTYKNPYGESLLAKCFWPTTFKIGGLKYWVKFVEKYGMPFMVGKVPRSAGDNAYTEMQEILDGAVQDFTAAIPDDDSIEILKANDTSSSKIYDTFIKFCNAEISKAILGQTLTTEAGDKGARALGEVHNDVRWDLIEGDIRIIEDTFNQLIRMLVDLNFGPGEVAPEFSLYPEKQVDKTKAEHDAILTEKLSVKFTKKYIKENYNLEDDDFDIVEKEENQGMGEEDETGEGSGKQDTPEDEDNPQFARAPELPLEFEALNYFLSQLDDGDLIKQGDFVKPLIEMVKGAKDYNDVEKKLKTIFSQLRPEAMEKMLGRALFNSQILGAGLEDQ